MSMRRMVANLAVSAALLSWGGVRGAGAEDNPAFRVWQVDSMTKIFEDEEPPAESAPLVVDAARNEVVSAQYAVRAFQDVAGLHCVVDPLVGADGRKFEALRVRFVGFVSVAHNSSKDPVVLKPGEWTWRNSCVRLTPGNFPDPLFEYEKQDLGKGKTQPVWITIHVPKDAKPGKYAGKVVLRAGAHETAVPLTVQVYAAQLPDKRTLWVTQWPLCGGGAGKLARLEEHTGVPCKLTEERYWELLRTIAKNMAFHRHNMILTPLTQQLVKATIGPDGKLTFDFQDFDRWVKLFQEEGVIGRIEGEHLAHAPFSNNFTSTIWVNEGGHAVQKANIDAFSQEAKDCFAQFLPILQKHLEEKGWLDIYLQHISDEPISMNGEKYVELATLAKQYAPKIRIIEPTPFAGRDLIRRPEICVKLVDAIDVWVPLLTAEWNYAYDKYASLWERKKKAGGELWFYTCNDPKEMFMNRFIDYRCTTANPDYAYWIYVPKSYADDNPAGLHLHFHGMSEQRSAQSFGRWAPFVETQNLIGINMEFADMKLGEQCKDGPGKARAALTAIAQTIADYKIVVGRGAVGCFSGGGIPCGVYVSMCARESDERGPSWPFTHCSLYSSNSRDSVAGSMPMSWFVGLGEKEWNMAALGLTQTERMAELLCGTSKKLSCDVFFHYQLGKGHAISDEDIRISAEGFRRFDLATAPFLYAPDYPEPEVRNIVAQANAQQLGRAANALDVLLAKADLALEIKAKAGTVRRHIDDRAEAILAVAKTLGESDPILAAFYAPLYEKALAGHPKEEAMKALLKPGLEMYRKKRLKTTQEEFAKAFAGMFSKESGRVSNEKTGLLSAWREKAGEMSQIGAMAGRFAEFLLPALAERAKP